MNSQTAIEMQRVMKPTLKHDPQQATMTILDNRSLKDYADPLEVKQDSQDLSLSVGKDTMIENKHRTSAFSSNEWCWAE